MESKRFWRTMRSWHVAAGKGIAEGRNLGVIDMRQIAPTLAQLLSLQLPAAKKPALNVQ